MLGAIRTLTCLEAVEEAIPLLRDAGAMIIIYRIINSMQ
jgi:hypothetical protein